MAKIVAELASLKAKLAVLNADCDVTVAELAPLKAKLAVLNAELAKIVAELAPLKAKLAVLNADCDVTAVELALRKDDSAVTVDELALRKDEEANTRAELDELKAACVKELSNSVKEYNSLKFELIFWPAVLSVSPVPSFICVPIFIVSFAIF